MKKTLSLILALLFICTALAGCADSTQNPTGETTASPTASSSPEGSTSAPEETAYPAPAVVDTDKYTYTMLVNDNSLWMPLYYSENDCETGEVIADALYRRETYIETKYNCQIEHICDSNADTSLSNAVYSGTDLCSVAFLFGTQAISLAKNGYLADINKIDGFSLSSPWWDQRIQSEFRIGKHLFTITGDIDTRDDLRTMTVIYNKALYEDYGYNGKYGTPYTLVKEGKWTYETLMEMIKGLTVDQSDVEGTWGMYTEVSAPYYFFLGTGRKALVNNNGEMEIKLDDETVYNTLEKMMNLCSNPDILVINGNVTLPSEKWAFARNQFKAGKVLFRSTTLSAVNDNTDMVQDYGILPVPNEGGTDYYCYVSGSHCSPVTIPYNLTGDDLTKTVAITEALAYYSLYSPTQSASLHDSFYELLGDGRLCRTFEDTAMLDIVFASKTFDMEQTSGVLGFESSYYNLCKSGNTTSLSSSLKGINRSGKTMLSKFVKNIEEKYGD